MVRGGQNRKMFSNMGQDKAIHFHYVIFHSLVFIVKFLVIVNPNLLLLCCNDVLYFITY